MVATATVTDADAAFGLRSGARALLTKSESENVVDPLERFHLQKRAQLFIGLHGGAYLILFAAEETSNGEDEGLASIR
jgi:hypothetical protein